MFEMHNFQQDFGYSIFEVLQLLRLLFVFESPQLISMLYVLQLQDAFYIAGSSLLDSPDSVVLGLKKFLKKF